MADENNTADSKKDGEKKDQEKQDEKDEGKEKKEFFKEELKRLENSLQREETKIKGMRPEQREHVPWTYTDLGPYYNTHTVKFLVDKPPDYMPIRDGYSQRQTAIGLCDPWKDLSMDTDMLPPINSAAMSPRSKEKKKRSANRDRPPKEGSTHLPKFPTVTLETTDLSTRPLRYSDVPFLRREIRKTYSQNAEKKINEDYMRTKQDFFRMELDRLEDVHPINRPNMRSAYFAYLQNTAGSRKAIYECMKNLEGKNKDNNNQKAVKA